MGYDRNTLERLFPQILIKEVKYTDEPVVLNDEMTPEEIVVSQVMHKKKCWSEEKKRFGRASFLTLKIWNALIFRMMVSAPTKHMNPL